MPLAAPDSEVDICNLALDWLKEVELVQVDPAKTTVEHLLARNYPQVRRAALRAHVWNFAKKRIKINPAPDLKPEFEYTHAYRFPSDFIRYVGRYDKDGRKIQEKTAIEGNALLRNGADGVSINVIYIRDITDVSAFDPLFIDYISLRLALKVSRRFGAQNSHMQTFGAMLRDIKAEATAIDGQEDPPVRIQHSRFIRARLREGGGELKSYHVFE